MEIKLSPAGTKMIDPPYRSYVEISLSQLERNYRQIEQTLPSSAVMMPVVKANAYGHGAAEVSRRLIEAGARWLAVSSVDEGVVLRTGGIPVPVRILVMAGILPFEWTEVIRHHLTPVLHSLEDVESLEDSARARELPIRFHFKIDTGLARLGDSSPAKNSIATFAKLQYASLEGCMTHLASAANLKSKQTDDQLARFEHFLEALAVAGVRPPFIHSDSTNSLHFPRPQGARHLVRPGHALYGYVTQPRDSTVQGKLNVAPILTWKTRILLLKDVPAGAPVGYGALCRVSRPTRIAVLGLGYADGYPHQLSNKGKVLVKGVFAPILGAISMDLTTIDVTGIPNLSVGDPVTLLGQDEDQKIDAIDIGRMAGTISYSILTNIHGRVARVYSE